MSSSRDARSSAAANRFLQQFLMDREQGTPRTLTEYQEMFPSDAAVIAVEYRAVTKLADDVDLNEVVSFPASGNRYRDLRPIGSGGMATVLRVFDPSLERDVAMKRLSRAEGKLPDMNSLGRFLEEAKVTGQLQHPGIVSVFEIGLDVERCPYFTMPVIAGRNLHEIVDAVHEGREEWTQLRVISLFVRVCEAMAYAHERGVVHRDLKPSNVMIGQFGETYVVDWGLARADGRPDRRDIRIRTGEDSLDGTDSALRTVAGDVIGTPAYMSPEQARGEIDAVGKQSDVYSIGAMLYHLLAGTPPYIGKGEQITGRETLARVLTGSPAPLVDSAPSAPPELIAVCERAMCRDAVARYASVATLGEDLRAYLENRVVRAYASGPLAELRKWVARNRATALASLAAVLALGFGFVWSEVHRRDADANAALALENAALATRNLDLAMQAGDDLLGGVGSNGITDLPGSDPVRGELLQKALAYYQRVRDLRGSGRRVETKTAEVLFRIAWLHTELGHAEEAEAAWQMARSASDAVLTTFGETPALVQLVLQADIEEQVRLLQHGQVQSAVTALESLAARVVELLEQSAESPKLQRMLVQVAVHLGLGMTELRNGKGASYYFKKAVEYSGKLLARMDDATSRSLHGSTQTLHAKLMWQLGQSDAALQLYETAIETLESGLRANPASRGVRYRLAEVCNLHAILLQEMVRPEDAEQSFNRSVRLFRGLATDNPGVRNYHGNLGGSLCNLGIMKSVAGKHEAAIPLLEEAIDEIRHALLLDRAAGDFRGYRVNAARELTIALLESARYSEAAEVVRELMSDLPDGNHAVAAKMMGSCANECGRDDGLSDQRRALMLARYGDEALMYLSEAHRRGQVEPGTLESSAYDAVRSRPEFQVIVEQVR